MSRCPDLINTIATLRTWVEELDRSWRRVKRSLVRRLPSSPYLTMWGNRQAEQEMRFDLLSPEQRWFLHRARREEAAEYRQEFARIRRRERLANRIQRREQRQSWFK